MNCFLFSNDFRQCERGGKELIDRWRADPGSVIWVQVSGPVEGRTEEVLRRAFALHPLALQDARQDRHPPKIEVFEEYTFLVFKLPAKHASDADFATIQLSLFVGDRFLVTRTSGESKAVAKLEQEVVEHPLNYRKGSGSMASRLIRLFVERFLEILLRLEPRLEELEEGLLANKDDSVLTELIGYKTELKKMRRVFLYHEQILDKLRRKPHPGFPANVKHEVNDVYEQQERAGSLAHLYYELASDLVDGFLSLSSHRLNRIMQVLTIVTVVFVPLSFLAGIYGMNFDNMPELHSDWGYFILLGVMASIASTLLMVFRKWKWFS